MTTQGIAQIPLLTFVLGGARSGKSRHAQSLARANPAPWVIIATAEALDEEMRGRIAEHKRERGDGWLTVEAPTDLAGALTEAPAGAPGVIDCLTLWLSNLMHAERDWENEGSLLAETLGRQVSPVVLVANEVGLGIAPMTPLGREFRDWQGRLNSEVAAVADAVVVMTAGLPRLVKPAPFPDLRFV